MDGYEASVAIRAMQDPCFRDLPILALTASAMIGAFSQAAAAGGLYAAQQTIREYQENLNVIFDNTAEGFLLLDTTGRAVIFNKSFETFITAASGNKPRPASSCGN